MLNIYTVDALQEIASKSINARPCTAVTNIAEGSYNKIFLLEFDNASCAIACIPSSIVQNTHLSTCSEVATTQNRELVLQGGYQPQATGSTVRSEQRG
ncbi:hypothetical protein EV421DRAFT_1506101 [Armillaria borealis]|uniref:Aminoglycoside phosphotransferase domain-containing protein n=1 Tax=Armillaria borealis TaxID=47425 RepID=A0AA39IXE3_9AGAR|nr:hypothetical protein EV421DRAFT_1506101 [Armillaria borealis]